MTRSLGSPQKPNIALCWFMLIDSDWCWFLLLVADWFWNIQINSGWCRFMLTNAACCWFILIGADWFWMMLIDAYNCLSDWFLEIWKLTLIQKVSNFGYKKMGLWAPESKNGDHFFHGNIPPNWWNIHLFYVFITFVWILSQFWSFAHFGQFLARLPRATDWN